MKRTFHIFTRRHITNRRFEGCRSVSVKKLHIEINRLVASFLNPWSCYYEDKESLLGERIDRYEQWDKTKLLISLRNMVRFNISRNSELWISVAFPKSMKQICCHHATAWISENRTPVLFIAYPWSLINRLVPRLLAIDWTTRTFFSRHFATIHESSNCFQSAYHYAIFRHFVSK